MTTPLNNTITAPWNAADMYGIVPANNRMQAEVDLMLGEYRKRIWGRWRKLTRSSQRAHLNHGGDAAEGGALAGCR
jgi:hypothetical protein